MDGDAEAVRPELPSGDDNMHMGRVRGAGHARGMGDEDGGEAPLGGEMTTGK